MKKKLHIICGPTASGKSAAAVRLAQQLHCEIVCADSRQFFKEMNIGTACPTVKEQGGVPHHLLQHLSLSNPYTIADFEQNANQIIQHLFSRYENVVLVGGSGMYIDALLYGLDEMPDISSEIRQKVQSDLETNGLAFLQEELKQKDKISFENIDLNNPRRLCRALEVIRQSGKPFSSFKQKKVVSRSYLINMYGLDPGREELYGRINARVDAMMQAGLLNEVKALQAFLPNKNLDTIGYSELFLYLQSAISLDEAIELIKRNTRRYAKRQYTWLRRYEELKWFTHAQDLISFALKKVVS